MNSLDFFSGCFGSSEGSECFYFFGYSLLFLVFVAFFGIIEVGCSRDLIGTWSPPLSFIMFDGLVLFFSIDFGDYGL